MRTLSSSRCCLAVFAWLSVTANAGFFRPIKPQFVGNVRYISIDGRSTSMEVLSVNPPIFHIKEFLTGDEVDKVIKEAKTAIRIGRSENHNTTLQRSQCTTLKKHKKKPLSSELQKRVLTVSNFFPAREYEKLMEPIQVVHYTKGGHYGCHSDTGDSTDPNNRMISYSVVLQQPEAGGEMVFPGADIKNVDKISWSRWRDMKQQCEPIHQCKSTRTGVTVLPKKGDAIMWYNMDALRIKERKSKKEKASQKKRKHGHILERTEADNPVFDETKPIPMPKFKIPRHTQYPNAYHCDAEVTDGEKWIANIWVNLTPDRKSGGGKEQSDDTSKSGGKRKLKDKKKKKKKKRDRRNGERDCDAR